MVWIVATPARDLSRHRTREAAFKHAAAFIRKGIGRRNLDVYKVESEEPLAPEADISYRISEAYDIRVRDGEILAQRYRGDGSSIGRPIVLGLD